MTREEAIKYLENSMAIGKDDASRHHNEILEFIIKALKQETVCIAEIKFSKEDMQKLVNEKIKEITAELEERKWIPVKERLPETDGEYLLFGKIDDFEDEYYKFIGEFDSAAEKFGICRDCFDPNTLGCLGSEFYEYGEVLAWMPLPEPYEGGINE